MACAGAAQGLPAKRLPASDLERAWFKVVATLDAPQQPAFRERCDELLQASRDAGIRRLTPFSLALTAQARALPPAAAEGLLSQAVRLDPQCPEARLAMAPVALRQGRIWSGASNLLQGLSLLATDSRLARSARASTLVALVLAALAAFGVWALAGIRHTIGQLWHDLSELGSALRLGINGVIVSILVLALPLLAAGDPVWVVLWVFALCWSYFGAVDKAAGMVGLALVAIAPSMVHLGLRAITHQPNAIARATAVLEDGRYDPLVLPELEAVADVFGDDPGFLRLAGDLQRQFGLLDEAAYSYQEGLRRAPADAALAMALGVVRFEEGDYNAALQAFQTARDAGADPVVANFNLSLALAQTYHFKESDEAMSLARAADPDRLRSLTRGDDHAVIARPFDAADARELLAGKDPVLLLNRGMVSPSGVKRSDLLHPLAIAGLVAMLVAIAHFLVREKTTGFASRCAKCGRSFCRRCKLAQESQTYCTQCINIFLKKDMVAIDAQLAKRQQLARRAFGLAVERRVLDLLVPGVGLWWAGRQVVGLTLAVLATASAACFVVWLPLFVGPTTLLVPMWPAQTLAAGGWLVAAVVAQTMPVARR